MYKILIIGGSGYLGSNFIYKFKKKIKVYAPSKKELNLLSKKKIDNYFKKLKISSFDFILNFCVFQLTGDHLVRNKKKIKEKNLQLSKNIIYLWKEHLPKSKLISLGASCAYSLNATKYSYTSGKLNGFTKEFAYAKRFLARKCIFLNKKYGMKYQIFVPGTLIGPGEQLNKKKMHFFNGALMRAALYKNKKNKKFKFILDKDVYRELSPVDDVSLEIFKNLKKKSIGIFNISPKYKISLKQFYSQIENRLNIRKHKHYKKTLFKAVVTKSYKVPVKYDLTKQKKIKNKVFLELFDETFNYFLKKTRTNIVSK